MSAARKRKEDPETSALRAMVEDVPAPCAGCGTIAHVCAADRWNGKWSCYSCGRINRWPPKQKNCVKCDLVIADPKLAAYEDEVCAGCGDPDEFES